MRTLSPTRMVRTVAALAVASLLLVGLAACSAPAPIVAPVIVKANDLQGATVKVPLNATFLIDTGSLPLDSYTSKLQDPTIAEFTQGGTDKDGTDYEPGYSPRKVGSTEVTLTNKQGGIQPLTFTLEVTPAT